MTSKEEIADNVVSRIEEQGINLDTVHCGHGPQQSIKNFKLIIKSIIEEEIEGLVNQLGLYEAEQYNRSIGGHECF